MKIGILGGTFNPPHRGHTDTLFRVKKELCLDEVFLIPSNHPPHKDIPHDAPLPEQRLHMAELAADKIGAKVSDLEIKRSGTSYTIDTVLEFERLYQGSEFFLIVGDDMFLTLLTWKDARALFQKCHFVVLIRSREKKAAVCEFYLRVKEEFDANVYLIDNVPIEISSTDIRNHFEENKEYLYPEVAEYIKKKNLYLVERMKSQVEPKRQEHVLSTAREAVKLAERWGADEGTAYLAGMLHDITKSQSFERHVALCQKYGIIISDIERQNPKLLHSITGAEFADRHFCIDTEIKSAIRWHTTGRADMTVLEKIIWTADLIEETRFFPGVDELRDLAYKDLDGVLLNGLRETVRELRENGQAVCGETIDAIKFLEEKSSK